MSIDFKDKVAIVTGAGGGLGREYALELARRGAKVVVNDLGGSRDGTGHSDMALQVVEEIEKAGGEAMANGASVTEYEQMEKMVADAEANKEADQKFHELVDARNQADNMIHTVEKAVKDLGDEVKAA